MSGQTNPPANTDQILDILKRCASEGHCITYRQLGKMVGLRPRFLGPHLGYIQEEICGAQGRPLLPALVVRVDTLLPGDGFWPKGRNPGSDADIEWWQDMVQQVYADNWSDVELES